MNRSTPDTPKLKHFTISEQEVLHILNSLHANKSTGPDGLPTQFLKLTALFIGKPLSKLLNKSLPLGTYPIEVKTAHVKPIFKNKGSPSDISNYQPSASFQYCRQFSKNEYKNIFTHIFNHRMLSDKQSGYRAHHSTELQLQYLTQNLY